MKTTIQSLPLELLRLCLYYGELQILYEDPSKSFDTNIGARNAFLLTAALVCKTWRNEAQSLLWDEVHVVLNSEAGRLLQSPSFGRFTTTKLFIDEEYLSRSLGDTIIARVRNLKHLSLCDCRLHLVSLCSPGLKDLVSLRLQDTKFRRQPSLSHNPLSSFRILYLDNYPRSSFHDVPIFSNITELHLVNEAEYCAESLHVTKDGNPLFASLAHQLQIVELNPLLHSDLPALTECSVLKRLYVNCYKAELDIVIKSLPSQLSFLGVGLLSMKGDAKDPFDLDDPGFIDYLGSLVDFPSLQKLARFEFLFSSYSRSNVGKSPGGPKLIQKALESKGVIVVYGDEELA